MNYSDERVGDFLIESQEHLDRIDRDIVTLERDPADAEALASVFRAMHTMKGTCGFFGFAKLEALAHAGEDILSRVRDREIHLDSDVVSALLALFDAIRRILASIEATRAEGGDDCSQLLAALGRLEKEKRVSAEEAPRPPAAAKPAAPAKKPRRRPRRSAPRGSAPSGVRGGGSEGQAATPGDSPARHGGDGGYQARESDEGVESHAGHVSPAVSETSVRVDVGLLDKLMNLVGELVLARNQVLQIAAHEKDRTLLSTSQRLNLITTEIQEEVMRTRLQRVGNLWSKFPRLVRDLSRDCGKETRLDVEGEDTELDRSIVEAIKAPLTHLLRNAVDHGIEAPPARLERGKPREGRIRLRAFHENGQVNIHLSDDGAGIDVARVKEKAIRSGHLAADKALHLSDRDALDLIFLPGFSTADKVTSVSGRGVGMDVVRTGIEKVGGKVEIETRPGAGTTVRMKIPLTLAILPALIVTSGGGRYALPQVSVLELVRLEASKVRKEIEFIKDVPVYRLRGDLIPIVRLDRELGLANPAPLAAGAGDASIAILQAEGKPFGLVVDKVNDTQEIVVKPLGKTLKSLSLLAGATVMGDGKVALILDVASLARRAGVLVDDKRAVPAAKAPGPEKEGGERKTVLLFRGPGDRRMVLPVSIVSRLEEFHRAEIEMAGDRAVVQYRGQVLPLFPVFDLVDGGSRSLEAALSRDMVHVVVYSREGRSAGILVDRILDIVEQPLAIQRTGMRKGVLGSTVLQGRVTEVLDVEGLIRLGDPDFFSVAELVAEGAA